MRPAPQHGRHRGFPLRKKPPLCLAACHCLRVPVVLWDERRTTVTAAGILSANSTFGADRKARLDSVSAAVILESFLAWRKAHPGEEPPEVAAPTAPEQA